ncbi:hypothetical protein GF357_03645, partial [Candidatus Dojkabacteria bacterium]|nr:hypothetical protein [Candidatus Dojkabacteria bacterium]
MKKEQTRKLWHDLAKNQKITHNIKLRNGKSVDIGFVNQFARHDSIPDVWFDWENRSDSHTMIIGQDWGPYSVLKKRIEKFHSNINKSLDYNDFLLANFSSRTEKLILSALERVWDTNQSSPQFKKSFGKLFFTVAVFFTRKGNRFRGNEYYDEGFGVKHSLPYL